MAEGRIEVKTRGLTQIKEFISASDTIPLFAFPLIVMELKDMGVEAGKASLRGSVGIYSTGHLEKDLHGLINEINDEHHQVVIGSDIDYAEHVSRGAGDAVQNKNVQIWPSSLKWAGYQPKFIWTFIGNRGPRPSHPFLEDAVAAIENNLDRIAGKYLNKGWTNAINKGKGAPPIP